MLRLRHGHSISRYDYHLTGSAENRRSLFWRSTLHRLGFLLAVTGVFSWPNAPNSTLENERFMALDIFTERMKPEAPSSAPAIINNLLSSTNPIAAADNPA